MATQSYGRFSQKKEGCGKRNNRIVLYIFILTDPFNTVRSQIGAFGRRVGTGAGKVQWLAH